MRKVLLACAAAAALATTGAAPASADTTCYVAGIDYCEIRDGIRDPIVDAVCDLLPLPSGLPVIRC